MASEESAQVQRAIGQFSSACLQESGDPHNLHAPVVAMFLLCKTSPDGIECRASRHRKTLILLGTSTFQMALHSLLSPSLEDDVSRSSSQPSLSYLVRTSMRYADLTEKFPRGSSPQDQKSPSRRVHRGIFNIASASNSVNTSQISSSLHEAVVASIRSETRCGGVVTKDAIGLL